MQNWRDWITARRSFWAVLAVGYALCLKLNLPGHLTVDSVTALYEGRFHERVSWGPPAYAWLLGQADRLAAGTGLYVVLSSLLLFGAWAALALLRPRVSWIAVAVAAGLVLTPHVLVYQGIVWKDVLFANLGILAFVCLALSAQRGSTRSLWLALPLSAFLLAFASLVRQNGFALWLPALVAVIFAIRPRRPGSVAAGAGAVGWLVLLVLFTQGLSAVATPKRLTEPDPGLSTGVRILQHYDIAGAAARDPARPLVHIAQVDPGAARYVRERSKGLYSPTRVDTLGNDPAFGVKLWALSDDTVRDEWLDIVLERPTLYLHERLAAFAWVLATPAIDQCVPASVGVAGPEDQLKRLGISPRLSPRDNRIYGYATRFFKTPVMSHLAHLLIAGLAFAALLYRGEPADRVMAAMLAAAAAFVASFFIISIACDYRYLYFLDLASFTAVIHIALWPDFRRATRLAVNSKA